MNKSCNFCHCLLVAADLVELRISILQNEKKKFFVKNTINTNSLRSKVYGFGYIKRINF